MKKTPKILFTLALIFIFNIGLANTNGNEKKADKQEQEQEGRRKANQEGLRPDGEVSSSQRVDGLQEEQKSEPQVKEVIYKPEDKKDSIEDDSVSKYNFIFYFLYKFKYEEDAP